MAQTKQTFKIGVANEGERVFKLSDIETWEPTKLTYSGSLVFFKVEENETFYSMNRVEFKEIFNK
jgi:hypothetical protein